jgi:hypothetical protein
VQFRIVHSVLATSLVALSVLPAVADDTGAPDQIGPGVAPLQSATPYDAGVTASERPTATLLPDGRDEPIEPLRLLALVALAISIGALRPDTKHWHVVYGPRHH